MKNQASDIPRLAKRVLEGNATQEEEFAFSNWVIHDPKFNEWVVEQVDDLPDKVNGFDVNTIYDKVKPRNAEHKVGIKTFLLTLAAMLTGFIAFFSIFHEVHPKEQPLMVRTMAGEKARITLPDGSSVILNSNTQLSYAYDSKEGLRNVNLVGEAWFKVKTDPSHPFVVDCDIMKVNCRGTEFNVTAYPDDETMTVVLKEGKISAMTARDDIQMKPNMMISLNRSSGEVESRMIKADDYCDWKAGKIHCDHITVDELAKRLTRTYGVNINIQSESLRQERLRGLIPPGRLENALDMICTTCAAGYSKDSSGNVTIFRKTDKE